MNFIKMKHIAMAVFLGIWLTLISAVAHAAPVGKITTLEGQADVTVQGVTSPCKMGAEVNAGDIIRTKKQSRVGITLVDGNVIWVAPLSRLRITQYSPEEGKQNYCDLFRGKTRVVVNTIAKGASLEVHTPTAVAGVRGTIFVGFFERGQSGFVFERGSGYGYNRQLPSKVVTIEAGHIMVVPKADQEPVVRPATKQEVERHIKDTTGEEKPPEKKAEKEKPQEKAAEVAKEEKKEAEAPKVTKEEAKPEPTKAPEAPMVTVADTPHVETKVSTAVQSAQESPIAPPPPPPPPIPTPPTTSTQISPVAVSIGGVTGSLSGAIDAATGTGTLNFTAQGTVPDFTQVVSGSLADGSSFNAYLAGVTGSWQGLFLGLAKKGDGVSLLTALLDDKNYAGSGALTATGTLTRTPVWSSQSDLVEKSIYVPYFSGISQSGLTAGMVGGTLYGYEKTGGQLYGIWGTDIEGGAYGGSGIEASWTAAFAAFDSNAGVVGNALVSDDGAGHVNVRADSAYYLDEQYYGTGSFTHRGVYKGTDYLGATAGTWELTPLAYKGEISGAFYDARSEDSARGGFWGFVGGITAPPWSGNTDIVMLGKYNTETVPAGKKWLWTGGIYGGDSVSSFFFGPALGIWNGDLPGAYRGVYLTAQEGGLITSDDLSFSYYPVGSESTYAYGGWRAQGTLTRSPMPVPSGFEFYELSSAYAPINIAGSAPSQSILGQGDFRVNLFEGSDGTILPWGVYSTTTYGIGLQAGVTNWGVVMGGVATGSYDDYSSFALLGEATGTRSESGVIKGTASGDFVTPIMVGTFTGPVLGVDDGSGYWGVASIGTWEGKKSLFGGEWSHSTIYNDSGEWAWNGEIDAALFGFTERTDGKLDFIAIGGFWDEGLGAAGYGGPYVLSGALYGDRYDSQGESLTKLEGFTGGLAQKAKEEDLSGTIKGYVGALYANFNGASWRLGLIRGNLSGNFYEMFLNEEYEETYDMFRVKNTADGLEVKEKTALLPAGLGKDDVWIDSGQFSDVRFAGNFNGTGKISGDYYWGKTKFLNYQTGDGSVSLPFGIYNLKIGDGNSFYQGKPSGSEVSFRARVGGQAEFGYDDGYWLASVSGNSWNEYSSGAGQGTIAGDLTGRYLTRTQTGTMTGPFYGLFQGTSEGTWIGLSVGTYEGERLAMSASLEGNLAAVVPGSLRVREFLSPHYRYMSNMSNFDPLQYEAIYFVPQGGVTDLRRTFSNERVEIPQSSSSYYEKAIQYYPASKWIAIQRGWGISRVIGGGETAESWSLTGDFPSAGISGNMNFYANPNPGTSTFSYGQFVPAYDLTWGDVNGIVISAESVHGLMGVLSGQSLWTSGPGSKASMVLMGTHGGYEGHQLVYTNGSSLFGEGAFFTDVMGIILDTKAASGNPMDGLLIGLYADGQGKVGVLKGEFSGYSYPEIGMWESREASAFIYRDGTLKDITGSTVSPIDLSSRVLGSGISLNTNGTLYGTFGGSGHVKTPFGIMGRTYFLDDQPDWGIFRLAVGLANNYEKPSGTGTNWSATLFSDAAFGRYIDNYGNPYHDLGMWYANLSPGTWENGKITGTLTGEFVTLLKKGVIEGKLLGTYESSGDSWQALGAGTWAKTQNVYFGSEIWGSNYVLTRKKYGNLVTSSYSYSFQYHDQGNYRYGGGVLIDGITANPPTKYTYYWYGMEGPGSTPERHIWTHTTAGDNFTYRIEYYENVDDYLAALADLAKDPKTGTPITASVGADFLTSNFSGVFAGLDNIWANIGTKATPVYLLADTNVMDVKGPFDLFRAEVVSVDPLVSSDPMVNSRSRVWDGKYGAYYGFLGGRNDGQASAPSLDVMFKALYLDNSGNYGLLFTDPASPLTGTVDENVGMWKAEGNIYGYPLGTDGISNVTPENFASSISRYDYSSMMNEVGSHVVGSQESGITLGLLDKAYLGFPAGPVSLVYGIEATVSAGTYTGTFPTAWTWTWERGATEPAEKVWILANVATKNNTFSGTTAEVFADWVNASIYVRGGDIKGIFDPNSLTWKSVQLMVQMETGKLIEKLNSFTTDAQREAFQKATRIPAFEIGRTNLTGTYSQEVLSIDMQSGTYGMRDVVFLAPSTGARPQIWATGSVSGRTLGTSVPTGTTVPLSNSTGSVTANFTFQAYMPCQGKWSATVNGNAPSGIGSYSNAFTFQGGAAGSIQGTVGSGDFTFGGKAAGIVPPK